MADLTSNTPSSSAPSTKVPAALWTKEWLDRRCSVLGIDVKSEPAVKPGSVMLVNPTDFSAFRKEMAQLSPLPAFPSYPSFKREYLGTWSEPVKVPEYLLPNPPAKLRW